MKNYLQNSLRLFRLSFDLYDHHLPRFFMTMVLPLLFLVLLNYSLFYFIFTPDFLDRVSNEDPAATWQFRGVMVIAGAMLLVVMVLFQIVLFKTIEAADQGKKLGIAEGYWTAWSLSGQFLFTILLILIKAVLWTFVFIVPGFVFSLLYSLASIVYLFDGKKGMEALKESKRLIKLKWDQYLFNLLFVGAMVFIVYWISDLLLANTFGVNYGDGEFSMLAAIGEGLFYLFTIMLSLFPPVFIYYQYKDLLVFSKIKA